MLHVCKIKWFLLWSINSSWVRRLGGHANEDRPYKLSESIDFRIQGSKVFRKILQEFLETGEFTVEVIGSFSYSC